MTSYVGLDNGTIEDDSCEESNRDYHPIVLEVLVVTVIAMVTVGGNLMTLFTFIGSRYLRNAHGLVIISLAFSDLGIGFVALLSIYPTAVQSWPHGAVPCSLLGFFYEVCHTNSFFVTIYLSIERYLAVIHPLKYTTLVTRTKILVVLITTWIAPFVCFGIPSLTQYFSYEFNDPILTCQVNWRQLNSLPIRAVFIWFVFTILNFGLVTYTCARVSMAMKEIALKRQGTQTNNSENKMVSRGVRQAIITFKISVVILFAFYFLRAPYIITILITGTAVDRCAIPELLLFFTYWISMVDGCFNFFVYVVMNKNFRREFKRLVLRQDCQPPKDTKTATNEKVDSKIKNIASLPVESSNNSMKKSEGSYL